MAQKYGSKREVELLDHFAHADLHTLLTFSSPRASTGPAAERDVHVLPWRGFAQPAQQLLDAAITAVGFSVVLAEVFAVAVAIPPFISKELLRFRDYPLDEPSPGG